MSKWNWLGTLADPEQLKTKTWRAELLGRPEPRVALIGRSNVGKSSLINALAGSQVARVSKTPGRTRAIQYFLDSETGVIIADLPGYGFARRSKDERDSWSTLIEKYLREDEGLVSLWILLDSRHGPTDVDQEAIGYLSRVTRPEVGFVPVFTKWDELKKQSDRSRRKVEVRAALTQIFGKSMDFGSVPWCSAKSGFGIDLLQRHLKQVGGPTE